MPPYLSFLRFLYLSIMFIFSVTMRYSGRANAQQYKPIFSICDEEDGNYTSRSTYKTNLDQVLSNLVTSAVYTNFSNVSYGSGSNEVYGIFYCRIDINLSSCHDCIKDAAVQILHNCTVEKSAVIWYDECTLRFASHSMYTLLEEDISAHSCLPRDSSNPSDSSADAVWTEMTRLTEEATDETSYKKVAYGITDSKVYCFVQCRPDMSSEDCRECLMDAINNLKSTSDCEGSIWAKEFCVNCQIRYDSYDFLPDFQNSPPPALSPALLSPSNSSSPHQFTAPPTNSGKNYIRKVVIPIVAAIIGSMLLLGCVLCYFQRKKIPISTQSSWKQERPPQRVQVQTHDLQNFDIHTVQIATNNFAITNVLGEGGFGVVYRGVLENGKLVAIKRLSKGVGQGVREFKTEVEVVARLQQRNLVQLLGFCIEGEERIVVYEFLLNLSLDKILFDQSRSSVLTWPIRYKIISGTARGLHYLHEDSRLTIIHRDLKTSNILLDDQFDPKIGDFGIARLVKMDETAGFTTKLVGTFGYMAPEYTTAGRFSIKSDVYSLGIIILEILSGLRVTKYYHPVHGEGLLGTAWRVWSEGSIGELMDSTIGNNYPSNEAAKCLHISLLCVQDDPARRPTMRTLLHMLSSNSGELPLPLIPSHAVTTYEINSSTSVTTNDDKFHHTGQSSSGDIGSLNSTCSSGDIGSLNSTFTYYR